MDAFKPRNSTRSSITNNNSQSTHTLTQQRSPAKTDNQQDGATG